MYEKIYHVKLTSQPPIYYQPLYTVLWNVHLAFATYLTFSHLRRPPLHICRPLSPHSPAFATCCCCWGRAEKKAHKSTCWLTWRSARALAIIPLHSLVVAGWKERERERERKRRNGDSTAEGEGSERRRAAAQLTTAPPSGPTPLHRCPWERGILPRGRAHPPTRRLPFFFHSAGRWDPSRPRGQPAARTTRASIFAVLPFCRLNASSTWE